MSTETARELGLMPGMRAVAVVKSTHVTVETTKKPDRITAHGAENA